MKLVKLISSVIYDLYKILILILAPAVIVWVGFQVVPTLISWDLNSITYGAGYFLFGMFFIEGIKFVVDCLFKVRDLSYKLFKKSLTNSDQEVYH